MGKKLPKKDDEAGTKMPSGKNIDNEAFITALGTLMTGQTNIDDSSKLKGQTESKGGAKPENTGLLGILSKMSNNIDVIVGGKSKTFFREYLQTSKANAKYLKENVLNNDNKESFFKKLPNLLLNISNIDKNLGTIINDMTKKSGEEGEKEEIDIEVSGGGDFEKLLDAFKNFNLGSDNKESLEELSIMTKKDGALSAIFENIDKLVDMDPDFEEFSNQLKNMGDASSEAVAIGNDIDKTSIHDALENFGEIAKVILALCAVGIVLLIVGLLAQYIDFVGVLKFIGMLSLFLAGITAVFILASKYMQPGSEVAEGIKQYILLVAVAAAIMIAGALFNSMIPFKDVIMFALKLGFFLLVLTGIFLMWNTLKGGVASGVKDAVIVVGLSAFILFLGAASFKLLDVGAILKFLFYLGVFLFGIVIVLLAVQMALNIGGNGDPSGPMREALLLVVGAAFIMFLGAACYKLLGPAAILGFITLFDLFICGLIVIITPLIIASSMFDKGAEVLRSVAVFVAIAAAVMLIGGGLIAAFPALFITIPMFMFLLNFFLIGLTAILLPLIAVSSIFDEGYKVMDSIGKLIAIAAASMSIGGMLIVFFPDLLWAIPAFIVMMDLMIGSVMLMMNTLVSKLGLKNAFKACMILEGVRRAVLGISKAFLILSIAAAIIAAFGGEAAFAIMVGCLITTITSLLGMMILISKMMDERKAALATAILHSVVSAVMLVSIAFGILGVVYAIVMKSGGIGNFSLLVTMLVGVLAVLSLGIVGLAYLLGNPMTAAFAMVAIGIVIAASAAFAIVAVALLAIAKSLKILSTIKSFDMMPLVKAVASLMLLTTALTPLALAMPIILMASVALTALTSVISKMAQAVKEYADLKISVYEGTKHVGYRSLTTKDFRGAAKNVSLVVTTLTEGIMMAYLDHPEWYGATGLSSLLENALNGGQTPLERVIRQSKLLAPLISKIADAVKDYADLKIKTYEGTKHVGYRYLKTKDFKDAAKNVSLVITTLTEGIMMAYKDHPERYGASLSLNSFVDWFTGNSKDGTPLERVIKHNMKLGPLISKIGEAIEEIANLKFVTKWDERGNAIAYKQMKAPDFQKASDNIVKVITTMSDGIMKVYDDHPEWYGTGGKGIGSFISSLFTNAFNDGTPMERVIAHDIKLAKLISTVADSIKDYAELNIPENWNEQGNVIEYRKIKGEDFTNAGDNVAKVMTTLSNGLMTVYDENPEWYENTGIFGGGDTPMEKVINTDTKLAKLISSVAASVKDYAELRMPDYKAEWKDGKPTKYNEMTSDDFRNAGKNIGLVVTTTAMGLMGYVPGTNGGKLIWVNGGAKDIIDKYILSDDDDKYEAFNRVLDASIKIGNVVSSLASGISNFSKMMFPDYSEGIDENGNPKKGYKQLQSNDFTEAANCITTVITTVATALTKVVNDDKELSEDQRMWNIDDEFEKSPLFKILSASEKMGSTISNIASGLAEYANMKFADAYDADGKPTSYKRLSEGDLKNAASKITDVITLVSETMIGIYEAGRDKGGNKNIWDIETNWLGQPKGELSPIERVINASAVMASTIETMAKGLVMFAGGNMGSEDKPVVINDTTLGLAKRSVTDVLKNVAETFADLAKGPDAKIFTSDAMDIIVESVGKMMNVVGTISTSLQNLAMLKVPKNWNEKGEPTEYKQMGVIDFLKASINIQLILNAIGNAFMNIASDPRNSWIINSSQNKSQTMKFFGKTFFENTASSSSEGTAEGIGAILDGMSTLATILSVMSGCIYGYATMRFPMGTDNEGKVQYSDPITPKQMDEAKTNINTVASTLADAMRMIINNNQVAYLASEEGSQKMDDTSSAFDTIISSITSMIEGIKGLTENEAAKTISTASKNLQDMVEPLTSILDNISEILNILFKDNEQKYGYEITKDSNGEQKHDAYSFAELMKKYQPMFDATGINFESFIDSIVKMVGSLGNMDKPLNESSLKINSLYNLFENEQYVSKIRSIIDNIGFMLQDMRKITQFDNLFVDKETGMAGFAEDVADFFVGTNQSRAEANREKAQEEINSIVEKLAIYSNLILTVTDTLKKINNNVSDVKMINYVEFNNNIIGFSNAIATVKQAMADTTKEEAENISIIIKSYSSALDSLIVSSSRSNGLKNFGGQVNQLEKFVKTVNSIKLLNLNQMNKFVTSLNQLANKMGNLDRLTEAIANKLSKVLEKLVERLAHAEQTIVKADEIQKRRHELIKKSVEEVSNLMKQPMTIEVQAMSSGTSEATTGADTNNQTGNNTNSTT